MKSFRMPPKNLLLPHLSHRAQVSAEPQVPQRPPNYKPIVCKPFKLYPVTPRLPVPDHILATAPTYVTELKPANGWNANYIELRGPEEIQKMRRSSKIASYIRAFAGRQVQVGKTTDEIDKAVHQEILRLGVYPSPLGFLVGDIPFPKSICTSVNQVMLHGIPDLRPLEEGDIVKIDCSVFVDGVHGDCCGTFVAGKADEAAQRLIKTTRLCLDEAIAICKPGEELARIGYVIQSIANANGYEVISRYCGHGVGKCMHQPPTIYHVTTDYEGVMLPGMIFTIEPALTEGSEDCYTAEDGWSAVATDNCRSAQIEETVLITETGVEVLTKHEEE